MPKTALTQEQLDCVADTLLVKYQVEDNLSGGRALFSASITLTNESDVTLEYSKCDNLWGIFFCHMRMVEPTYLPVDESVDLEYAGVQLSHLNGSIFKLSPLKSFKPLKKGDTLTFKFNGQHYSASRSDVLPNWYIHVEGLEPRVIKSTAGESLEFVGPFDAPKRYKRFDYTLASGKRRNDIYQPFSPEVRFFRYTDSKSDDGDDLKRHSIVPTPAHFEKEDDSFVDISLDGWSIATSGGDFENEVKYLSEKTKIQIAENQITETEDTPSKCIVLKKSQITPVKTALFEEEAYELVVDSSKEFIEISANNECGIFYGIQTLLSLSTETSDKRFGLVQACVIKDAPRFSYRGMHADISRNFQPKEEILRLLDAMALYKLNKFHFHLTDDEGWRIEIPGLEELTEIGARRGHDPSEDTCLLPLLGSGPFPEGLGCGYYTVEDYKEILYFAKARHIEVIPELDMPGHSHAAVRAMKVRYDRLKAQNKEEEGKKYLLSDPSESNRQAFSVQMLADNSMNPGLDSTYAFVDKVIEELKAMHADISPLKIFHLGGDEVPFEAWDDSPACHALVKSGKIKDIDDLMEYFVVEVGKIVHKHGLQLGAWQDGIITKASGPYKRSKFAHDQVLVHYWRNVWETGHTFDAYKLANEGYEVVLAPGTHLYFDHPYEPDPEERGLYWACRFLDTHKVFKFVPENLMSNAEVKLTGEKITKSDLRAMRESSNYTELKKPEKIIGLQGQIWTELIRTAQQFHEMIFPRLLALAERAWHKAPWEELTVDKRKADLEEDWKWFASNLGHKELARLEKEQVPYHIPCPGARVSGDGHLEMRACYPGQPMSFSLDNGETWQDYSTPVDVTQCEQVLARVSSFDGKNHSRVITIPVNTYTDSDDQDS